MQYVRMGSTGAQVSRLCLGCMSFGGGADWMLGEDDSLAIVRKAIEGGVNFFDTADVYSRGQSEEILGRSLKALNVRRDEAVVATKVFNIMGRGPNRGGLSRKHIHQSIDASLQRLGMDYVDLYQIHRFDYETPIEETIEALDDVVKAGKAMYVGASSMFGYQFSKYLNRADQTGRTRFSMMQNHYNLLYREEEREMNPLCLEEGVGLIPWSPLAGGVLAGSREAGTTRANSAFGRDRYHRPADQAVIDALREVAEARGESRAQVAIAWLLSKPVVTAPIVGATRLSHLDAPLAALDSPLGLEEIAKLEAPYEPQAVIGALGPDDLSGRRPTIEFRLRAAA
ncbi:MAG TPA: aldo/keto reductase [Caulobacteraceae bacterium]|jgi:aryl-alcohol dehydrogenase-like predicted oxidoreductase|nr:aldo/keto reductase [Caulobacteraceae bacterium]